MSTPLSQNRNRAPRFVETAAERARLTVVPRHTHRVPRVPFVSLVSVLLVGGVAGLLLLNTNMQQASFVATSLEQQAAVLAGKEESLRMQLHRLRDPQHIASRAQRLGMVPAATPAFIRLSDGKVLGRPTVARPGDGVRITPLPAVKPSSLRPQLVIADVPAARRDRSGDRSGDRVGGRRSRRDATRRPEASRARGAQARTAGAGHDAAVGPGRAR